MYKFKPEMCYICEICCIILFKYSSDLLEDRRTIDVIITKFFPLCFKMAESLKNLDNILRDWEKEKVQKKSCRGIEQVREAAEEER